MFSIVALTGLTVAQQAATPTAQKMPFYTPQRGDMPISNLYDLDVYNAQDEVVGEIEDVIIDEANSIRAIVIEVEGPLGISERYVAVEPTSLVIMPHPQTGRLVAMANTTSEELRTAPRIRFEGHLSRPLIR